MTDASTTPEAARRAYEAFSTALDAEYHAAAYPWSRVPEGERRVWAAVEAALAPPAPDDIEALAKRLERDTTYEGADGREAAAALRRLAGAEIEARRLTKMWARARDRATAAEARVAALEEVVRELRSYAASVWFDEADASDEERQIMDRARAALAEGGR